MTPEDIRRLWRRDLDPGTLAEVDRHERTSLAALRVLVRAGVVKPGVSRS